jgi:sugar phosphate isomerase/epimerase
MIPLSSIAVQLFTVREHCNDAASLAATARKLSAIGFRAVQVSGVGPIDPVEIRRICDGEGLVICATHESGKRIVEETAAVADRLAALGCGITAYPWPHLPLTTLDEVKALAAALDTAGEQLAARGVTLCYHNHDIEFRRFAGRTALEWIYGLTRPAFVQGEPDMFWVQRGGGSPVDWCRRLVGRLPILHLKDFAFQLGDDGQARQFPMCMVGDGNLDWPAILSAARDAGCRWYAIELDDTFGEDPFTALARGFAYLRDRVGAR